MIFLGGSSLGQDLVFYSAKGSDPGLSSFVPYSFHLIRIHRGAARIQCETSPISILCSSLL
jgi:hypothetical protein